MQSLSSPQAASEWCDAQRIAGKTVGYVPTMGALHAGHLSLVKRAVAENDAACVSIFVNPLQFNHPDDCQNYPRNFARDCELLQRAGCDMVFTGELRDFFSRAANATDIPPADPGPAGRGLEGEFRPGHLPGVCAIVERLFRTVGKCAAYFGEKDFQQTLVVARLAQHLGGIRMVVCPTVREADGLAMSSRNRRLTGSERAAAAKLYQSLLAADGAWRNGMRDAGELENIMRKQLTDPHIRPDYATIRDPNHWSEHAPDAETLADLKQPRALIAAHVGDVRLIDNLELLHTGLEAGIQKARKAI